MAQRKLDCFFRPKVPRLEERVQDDGNSGEDDDKEENVANKDQGAVPSKKERVFQSAWQSKYTWLAYDADKKIMTCKICVQARKSNAFTQGNSNFRTGTLSRHAASSDHQAALVGKSMESSFTKAIESSLKAREKGDEVDLKSIYWLAKEGISTHKYSNLLSFLEILDCPNVQELHCGANATYRTDVIADELQDSIAQVIREDIDKETEQSSCISILADESTDISVTQMLVVYMRLISLTDFKPVTHFLTNVHVLDGKAATVTEAILKALKERKIPISTVTGFGSGGASAMSSNKEGVAGKLKRLNPNIISVHCIAHKLQLCVSQAAEKVKFLKEFQEMLTSMFYHFKKSALRTEKLKAVQEVLNEPQLKYKGIHQVRWLSFYKALETLYLTWDSLVTYFEQEVENKQDKDGKLKGYIKKLTQFDFVATIHMFMDVLLHVMELTHFSEEGP